MTDDTVTQGAAAPLPVVIRPNGKPYQPRKVIAEPWENSWGDEACGVMVLGTHDIERARAHAEQIIQFGEPGDPYVGWYRDSFNDCGERAWIDDPVRGRAGVIFTAVEASDANQ